MNQLTFLHIYHHSSMFVVWWVGAKFVPGGSALTGAVVNSVVHVLMYTYYALSAIGPKMQPFLWWKKYLTIIQLVCQNNPWKELNFELLFTLDSIHCWRHTWPQLNNHQLWIHPLDAIRFRLLRILLYNSVWEILSPNLHRFDKYWHQT